MVASLAACAWRLIDFSVRRKRLPSLSDWRVRPLSRSVRGSANLAVALSPTPQQSPNPSATPWLPRLQDTAAAEPSKVSHMSEQDAADRPWLSIVIPAFNEARRLPVSLPGVRTYVERQRVTHGRRCEVLVVDDGSTDATADVVVQLAVEWPELQLV